MQILPPWISCTRFGRFALSRMLQRDLVCCIYNSIFPMCKLSLQHQSKTSYFFSITLPLVELFITFILTQFDQHYSRTMNRLIFITLCALFATSSMAAPMPAAEVLAEAKRSDGFLLPPLEIRNPSPAPNAEPILRGGHNG